MCWTCHLIAFVGLMVLTTGLRANGPQNWDKQQFWCSYTTYFLSPYLGRPICLTIMLTTCPSNLQGPSVHVRCCSTRGGRMSSHSRKSLVCQDYGATLSQGRCEQNKHNCDLKLSTQAKKAGLPIPKILGLSASLVLQAVKVSYICQIYPSFNLPCSWTSFAVKRLDWSRSSTLKLRLRKSSPWPSTSTPPMKRWSSCLVETSLQSMLKFWGKPTKLKSNFDWSEWMPRLRSMQKGENYISIVGIVVSED